MKKPLIITCFVLIGLAFWGTATSKEHPGKDFKTFTEYLHHSCSGASAIGGICSATCRDRCDCVCNSNFFTCYCTCSCPDKDNLAINSSLDPGPESRWETLKTLIDAENSEVARNLSAQLMELYQLGVQQRIDEYNALSQRLDQELMKLNKKTLNNIVKAFS